MTDVNALNRDFARYDQVEKKHTYRLAEHPGDAFDVFDVIAVQDFGQFLNGSAAERKKFVEASMNLRKCLLFLFE